MSQSFLLTCGQQEALLVEAVSRRHQIDLSCRLEDGWAEFKSRLLAASPTAGHVIIEYPWRNSTYMLEFAGGECVGVSFRRSHKKCLFETVVIGPCRFSSPLLKELPALKLAWPNEIHELQRRMFYRAPVPEGRHVAVNVYKAEPAVDNPQGPARYTGRMLDISAGGISLALQRGRHPRWENEAVVECCFTADEPAAIEVVGRVRHLEPLDSEEVRLGVQFAGLETSASGRATLQKLLAICGRYQQAEMQRLRSL